MGKDYDKQGYLSLLFFVFLIWFVLSALFSIIWGTLIVGCFLFIALVGFVYNKISCRLSEPINIDSDSSSAIKHTTEILGQDQAYYTGEDGHAYRRIREYELRGLLHRGAEAKAFVDSLRYKTSTELEDVKLYLLREPDNEYDQWAIKVLNSDGLHIGYVQREASEQVSTVIDNGKYLEARFTVVTYSDIKMSIFHLYSDGNDDELDELMDYDRIAELEQKYLEKQRIKAELEQQRIRKKRAEARRAERLRKQEYIGYELEAENKIEEAIVVLSKLVDEGIESHSAHHRLCIMLRKTKSYEDELWVAEKWLELAERQRRNNIDVTTEIIKVKRRIAKIHTLMGGE